MASNLFKPKIRGIINPNKPNFDNISVCLFWDYENVSLSPQKGDVFLFALKNLFNHANIVFAKVFFRQDDLNQSIFDRIKSSGLFSINIIKDNSKNAVDRALINSLTSIRRTRRITHVILITGDNDYRKLIVETYKWTNKIILISRRKSTSLELSSLVHTFYAFQNLLDSPENWWRRSIT